MSQGRAVSNFTPYQCSGSSRVFSMLLTVKSAAILAASVRPMPLSQPPVKEAAYTSPVPWNIRGMRGCR